MLIYIGISILIISIILFVIIRKKLPIPIGHRIDYDKLPKDILIKYRIQKVLGFIGCSFISAHHIMMIYQNEWNWVNILCLIVFSSPISRNIIQLIIFFLKKVINNLDKSIEKLEKYIEKYESK